MTAVIGRRGVRWSLAKTIARLRQRGPKSRRVRPLRRPLRSLKDGKTYFGEAPLAVSHLIWLVSCRYAPFNFLGEKTRNLLH